MNDECKYQASEYALSTYNISLSCTITLADHEELCVINVTGKATKDKLIISSSVNDD